MPHPYAREEEHTFRGSLDWPGEHPFYGCHVHPGGTENYVEDDLIDGIDLIRRLVKSGRRFTANYDRKIDPFVTTWDLEVVDDDLPSTA